MKKLKKILSVLIAAAMLLTTFIGVTAFANSNITGTQLKAMAEKNLLEQNPNIQKILETEFIQDNNISNCVQRISDFIDPEKTFSVIGSIISIANRLANGAKSFDEAAQQSVYRYYMPLNEKFENVFISAYSVDVITNEKDELYVTFSNNTAIYDFDSEYDKVAEVINESNIGTVTAVYLIESDRAMCISTENENYLIFFKELNNKYALYIGKPETNLAAYTLYPFSEYMEFAESRSQDFEQANEQYNKRLLEAMPEAIPLPLDTETIKTENTDSFSKYIGTEPQYSDINQNQSAVINQLTDLGVITGNNGMFFPDESVTRAEASAMLCRLFDIETQAESSFTDVDASHWAAGYINALSDEGIISGFADGTFRPEEYVTYEQIFKMTAYLLGYTNVNTDINNYYVNKTIYFAVKLGFTDDLNSFDIGDNISRIELACILSRALDTHIVTRGISISGSEAILLETADITLSTYKNGGSLSGIYVRSDEALKDLNDKLSNEFAEKCGAIIDEYNNLTGQNHPKKLIGITYAPPKSTNPVPRITQN